jgi:2-dehydro-3-deoxygalactonokinase
MIAVDWGTSSFRAYRLDAVGHVQDRRDAAAGILAVAHGVFADTLRAQIGPWIAAGETQVLMSGMIGSRQGWREAPYARTPAGADEIAGAMVSVPFDDGVQVWIAPGVMHRTTEGFHDVMRGEETQIVGVLRTLGSGTHRVCLPGTHSKWVELVDGRIVAFRTHMTGEVFAVLRAHSILGRTIPAQAPFDADAFRAGVLRAREASGLLHHLFEVRAQFLADALTAETSADYLSGVLIGHELAAERPAGPVHLLGAPALCDRYALACDTLGVPGIRLDPDAAVDGLVRLAQARKLIA